MTVSQRNAREWLRDGRLALSQALSRRHPARGWEALQERDDEGQALGPLPYTEQAIAEFTAAHECDPEDIGVVHHLAIARHARAWDWELQGDPRAASEWAEALKYWRMVAASGEFWAALKAKLLACHAEADPAWLDEVRRDLLEHLLEVHVAFVRHYCDSGAPKRATEHIEIVRRAQLPLAVKKRLVDKVFEAMTGVVPEVRATGRYDAALAIIELFLELFPDHLAALRMHAEVAKAWVIELSFQTCWAELQRLSARVEPYARRLTAHPGLSEQPLAQAAFEELAFELAVRGHNRGEKFLAAIQPPEINVADRDAAAVGFELALTWERLGGPRRTRGSQLENLLGASLQGRSVCFYFEAQEVKAADLDERTRVSTARQLYRDAVGLLEEALKYATEPAELQNILRRWQEELDWFNERLKLLEADWRSHR